MNRILAMVIACYLALGCAMLAGCSDDADTDDGSLPASGTEEDLYKAEDFVLMAEISDAAVVEAEGLPAMGDSTLEYAACVVLTVNQPVVDITLLKLDMGIDDDGNLIENGSEVLGTLDEAFAADSFAVYADLGETVPMAAVSMQLVDGTVKQYYIQLSGMDGSAILTEY